MKQLPISGRPALYERPSLRDRDSSLGDRESSLRDRQPSLLDGLLLLLRPARR
jgi:hypothetical protein